MSEWFQINGIMVQSFALIVTLGVLIWYTIETHRLRKETTKQTELQLRPFIILASHESSKVFRFMNIGKGTAMHINMASIIIKEKKLEFREKDYLNPLEPYALEVKKIDNKKANLHSPYKYFQDNSQEVPFTIEYENINNKKYKTEGIIKGSIVIIKKTE